MAAGTPEAEDAARRTSEAAAAAAERGNGLFMYRSRKLESQDNSGGNVSTFTLQDVTH